MVIVVLIALGNFSLLILPGQFATQLLKARKDLAKVCRKKAPRSQKGRFSKINTPRYSSDLQLCKIST